MTFWLLLTNTIGIAALFGLLGAARTDRSRSLRFRSSSRAAFAIVAVIFLSPIALAPGSVAAPVAGLLWLVAIASAVALGVLLNRVQRIAGLELYRGPTSALRHSFLGWWKRRFSAARNSLRRFNAEVAPAGWRELRVRHLSLDMFLSFRFFFLLYAIAVALIPVALAAIFLGQFSSQHSPFAVMFPTWVNYLSMLLASCWSVALIATIALLVILRAFEVITWKLDVAGAVRMLAASSGIGVVCGGVIASILPAVGSIPPFAQFATQGSLVIDGASPDLLLAATAGGGILGFIVGQIGFAVALGRHAQNLVYGSFLIPLIFLALTAMFALYGFYPRALLARIAGFFRGRVEEVVPSASPGQAERLFDSDWRSTVLFLHDHFAGGFPDAPVFVAITGVAVLAFSSTLFIAARRKRAE